MDSRKLAFISRALTPALFESHMAILPGSNPPEKLGLSLAPLFKGMPTGLKEFLEPPGVCGSRFCDWFPQ